MPWAARLVWCGRPSLGDVIRVDDIDKLLDRPGRDGESIPDWCRRNHVDEPVILRLAEVYGFSRQTAALAIDAFRLGHEARQGDEPKAKSSPSRDGCRYGVEFVVVDRNNGRIVGDPSAARSDADSLAEEHNAIAAQASR